MQEAGFPAIGDSLSVIYMAERIFKDNQRKTYYGVHQDILKATGRERHKQVTHSVEPVRATLNFKSQLALWNCSQNKTWPRKETQRIVYNVLVSYSSRLWTEQHIISTCTCVS